MGNRPIPKKFTSWSFSRYTDWLNCNLKAKLSHLVKLPTPKNDAMVRGGDIHKMAEAYLKGGMSALPKELVMFTDLFEHLKEKRKKKPANVLVEGEWAFREDWSVTKWDDWDHCWLRVKLDAAEFSLDGTAMIVYDWKTGRVSDYRKGEYQEQLELYAAAALSQYPKLDMVMPKLCYLDSGDTVDTDAVTGAPLEFYRPDLEDLQDKWADRVRPMLNDTKFPAKPNKLCGWCPFSKAAGGPCKY